MMSALVPRFNLLKGNSRMDEQPRKKKTRAAKTVIHGAVAPAAETRKAAIPV